MRVMMLIVCSMLFFAGWAGLSSATPPTISAGADPCTGYTTDSRDLEVWCQNPDVATSLITCSQQDGSYPFEAWVADDYLSETHYSIISVRWWGGTWQSMEVCHPDYFLITLHGHDGSCYPGAVLYQETVDDGQYTVVEIGERRYEYHAFLPSPMPQNAGQWYWLCIQAGMAYDPCGQWGWMTSTEAWGCESLLKFPLIGIVDWEPIGEGDVAFCLYADETISTMTATWGSVRALYR